MSAPVAATRARPVRRTAPAGRVQPVRRGAAARTGASGSAATARVPARRAPRAAPVARPDLRVVDAPVRSARWRRRRAAALLTLVASLVFGALFGLTVFHTVLVQGQAQLDELDARIDEEQSRLERLRVEVAGLEAPDRILAEAQRRLGMVTPEEVVYVTPPPGLVDRLGFAEEEVADTGAIEHWADVKPYLASQP